MKQYGINQDGRKIGPIDPAKVNDTGWTWYDTADERNGALANATLSVATRKAWMQSQARAQHKATLKSGFIHNGVTWAASPDAVEKTMMLALRITAGKGLPNGKSTITLYDAIDQPHSLTASEVDALGEHGSDFRDQADDRLAELLGQIAAATSHAELDAIEVTTGWP